MEISTLGIDLSFGIEFSYLHVSKEDSIKPRCDQLDSQLFEAEYLADEDSVLVCAQIPNRHSRRASLETTSPVCFVTQMLSTLRGSHTIARRKGYPQSSALVARKYQGTVNGTWLLDNPETVTIMFPLRLRLFTSVVFFTSIATAAQIDCNHSLIRLLVSRFPLPGYEVADR